MQRFGEAWRDHPQPFAENWRKLVTDDDWVLIAGDISWALRPDAAEQDLQFLADLPGKKILSRGNHDFWWSSNGKVRNALPEGLYALGGDAMDCGDFCVAATRLWEVPKLQFSEVIDWLPNERGEMGPKERSPEQIEQDLKIYQRECARLDKALECLAKLPGSQDKVRIAMVHYPPISLALGGNELTERFEDHRIDHVIFGHLHAVRSGYAEFGIRKGVHYHLTSSDYLQMVPKKISRP